MGMLDEVVSAVRVVRSAEAVEALVNASRRVV